MAMRGLSGKAALVTGGSSGLGEACVLRLAEEGVSVAVGGRDAVKTDAVVLRAREIARDSGHDGTEFTAVVGDVSSVAECERIAAEAIARLGRIDVLVNVAGVWLEGKSHEMTEADYEFVVGINLKGVFFMCKEAIKDMLPRRDGVIINVSSISGLVGGDECAFYTASKSGVVMMTRGLAIEYGPSNIRAVSLCPGRFDTPMSHQSAIDSGDPEHFMAHWADPFPLGRIGRPEELAATVAFLASEEAPFITGRTIAIDGAETAGCGFGLPH